MITMFAPQSQKPPRSHHGKTIAMSKSFLLGLLVAALAGCSGADAVESSKFQQALQDFLAPTGVVQVQVVDGITPALINEARTDIAEVAGLDFLPGTTLAALKIPEITSKCTKNPCISGDSCLGDSTNWSVDFGCLCAHSGHCVGHGVLTQLVESHLADGCNLSVVSLHYDKVRYLHTTVAIQADGDAVVAVSDCGSSGTHLQSFQVEWFDLILNDKWFRGGKRHFSASEKTPEVLVYALAGSYVLVDKSAGPEGSTEPRDVAIRGADGVADCTVDQSGCGVCWGRASTGYWNICASP